MAACMAPPWPSQRNKGFGNSERHSALARMRERRAGRDADQDCRSLPKAPLSARTPRSAGLEQLPAVAAANLRRDGSNTPDADERGAVNKPWSPAWMPDSPRPRFQEEARSRRDADKLGATTRDGFALRGADTPRCERPARRDVGEEEEFVGSSRVRGPAEARASRRPQTSAGAGADQLGDEELPRGAKGADFRTLQEMIAKGIVESETGASKMEAHLKADELDNDEDLKRHREMMRRRREEAEQARLKEREQAKHKRQREWEERDRKFKEELERDEKEALQARETQKAREERCRQELAAASLIQATFRGRRSRAGMPLDSPVVRAVQHSKPWTLDGVKDLD
eukprot:TRINITY_DN43713_c0_g1_i1.p1 TRINITY_DN43713_c0_g1~~TRINITY_DN43713_c0_g1_i1.p1  ORF type:complete len:342 (+),score=93.01 TRINITY_DN43713_c0_g1_i1:107-1132(+)